MSKPRAILIAGPTASGKSALALELAERLGGVVINADALQVYAELRIVTARPGEADLRHAPHRLYGHVPAREAYSAARWAEDVARVLAEAEASDQVPIIVGGTGLYFKVLLEGLSPVPEIPPAVRARWRAEATERGGPALHAKLAARDPVMAARLQPADVQRVTRALEVIDATGRSLAEWQTVPGRPLLDAAETRRIVLALDRAVLAERIERRFAGMIEAGAVEEVEGLLALGLDGGLPAMRAVGVPPLAGYVRGEMGLQEAVERAVMDTRRYVKRQMAWGRRFMGGGEWVREGDVEEVPRRVVAGVVGRTRPAPAGSA